VGSRVREPREHRILNATIKINHAVTRQPHPALRPGLTGRRVCGAALAAVEAREPAAGPGLPVAETLEPDGPFDVLSSVVYQQMLPPECCVTAADSGQLGPPDALVGEKSREGTVDRLLTIGTTRITVLSCGLQHTGSLVWRLGRTEPYQLVRGLPADSAIPVGRWRRTPPDQTGQADHGRASSDLDDSNPRPWLSLKAASAELPGRHR
jgi:hypothetical protein